MFSAERKSRRPKEAEMNASSERLSEEHREFVPLIAAIERAEVSAGEAKGAALRLQTAGLHETLTHGLLPHAVGEGRTVFPVLRRITGQSETSVAMTRDHREIARLTDELEQTRKEIEHAGLTAEARWSLLRVLHDLRDSLQRHFEEEEQICFQVLSAELSPDEAREMCQTMELVASEVRRVYE
jgi:iron-sulfur cluster repair protein YtfE (RIC family)